MTRPGLVTRTLAFALATLWPALAQACPVCFSLSPRSRWAFLGTTIFLSLLPLGMIGGGLWWLRRIGGAGLADEFVDRDEPSSPGERGKP